MKEIILKVATLSTSNFNPLAGMDSKVKRKRAYITPASPEDSAELIAEGIQLYTPDAEKTPDGKPFFIIPFAGTTTIVDENSKKIYKTEFKDELNANFGFKDLDIAVTIVPASDTNPKQFARVTGLHLLPTSTSERFQSNQFGVNMDEYITVSENGLESINFQGSETGLLN